MPKRRQKWIPGDIFLVPQLDNKASLGQILDMMMKNVVTCAYYDIRVEPNDIPDSLNLPLEKLIATASSTREQLDYWQWKVIGHMEPALLRELWANEKFRSHRWVGARIYDAAIIENFLNAYYALSPWNGYHDPEFFDKLLAFPTKKPKNLIYR